MAKTNVRRATTPVFTHEGAHAVRIPAELMLRRSVMANMLFEDEFYEDGQTIAERIASEVKLLKPEVVSTIALEARGKMNIRHASLLVAREMARNFHGVIVGMTISEVIQRADELAEFVALYWKDGRKPLSAQAKLGLAAAFHKFDRYQLAKYNRDEAVKLRDVLFLCHAKPRDEYEAETFKMLVEGTLPVPDTWETALSAKGNTKAEWERLIAEKKLGAMAFLRNLRNMTEARVGKATISEALAGLDYSRVLPFRFISAALACPQMEPVIESAFIGCASRKAKLDGSTAILIDVSGSMSSALSQKSQMTRMDAACGIAMIAREMCPECRVFTFSDRTVEVPARSGFALRDAIIASQSHSGTYMNEALRVLASEDFSRLIVISDEQSHTSVSTHPPFPRSYMVNVASAQNGVGYGGWTHIDGFSEAVLDYIREYEALS